MTIKELGNVVAKLEEAINCKEMEWVKPDLEKAYNAALSAVFLLEANDSFNKSHVYNKTIES